MPDIMLHDLSDALLSELQVRAQKNRRSIDQETVALVEEALLRSKYRRITTEQGPVAAFQEMRREFDVSDEFDTLRGPVEGAPPGP